MRQDGKSIILITHKLEEIISIVDEVTVLRDGKWSDEGLWTQVLQRRFVPNDGRSQCAIRFSAC